VNVHSLVDHHKRMGKLATVTAVTPPGRFGALNIEHEVVKDFNEKPIGDGAYINGGFFVLNSKILEYIDNDFSVFEQDPLMSMAKEGQLSAYMHRGYWQCVDNVRDLNQVRAEADLFTPPWLEGGQID